MAFPNKKTESIEQIQIKPIDFSRVNIVVIGDSQMVQHRIGESAIDKLEDSTREKKLKGKRQPRNIEKEYNEATYFYPDDKPGTIGCPAMWFKQSMVNACSFIEGINKTTARASFFVEGDMVKVNGERKMRTDVVRLGGIGKTAQTRYRPEIFPWWVELTIRYRPDLIQLSDLSNLLNHAGFSVGVGEDRPQKRGGQWGLFHVASAEEMKTLTAKGGKKKVA